MNIVDRVKSFIHSAKDTFVAASTSLFMFGLDSLFNTKRKSDATLVKEGYASNTDVYSIITRIANNGAAILPTFEQLKGGAYEMVEGAAFELPILEPRSYQSYTDWLFSGFINLLASGDLFLFPSIAVGLEDKGPGEYRVLESAATEIEQTQSGEIKQYVYMRGTKWQEIFQPEQIIHIKYADPSLYGIESMRGLSPLQAGYLTLTASTDTEHAGAVLLKNKGAAGFISDKSEDPMDPKDYVKLQKKLNKDIGGATNFNKIKVTRGDYKFIQLGMSPADLKIIENQVLTMRKLCNCYHVSSSLFNDPQNKTFNNMGASNKAMYQDAVLPTWKKIFEGIARYIKDAGDQIRIKPDTSDIEVLQADKLKESQKNQRITESVLKINENISNNSLTLAAGRAMLVTLWHMTEAEAEALIEKTTAGNNGQT